MDCSSPGSSVHGILQALYSNINLKVKKKVSNIPGGPVIKNPPCNAGDVGSIPGQGTKIPYALKQLAIVPQLLNMRATPRESVPFNERSHLPQLRPMQPNK